MRPNSIIMKQEACQAAEKGHDEFLKALCGAAGIIYANTQSLQKEYYALADQLSAVKLLEKAIAPLIQLIESQGADDILRRTPINQEDKAYWLNGLATEVKALIQSSQLPRRKILDVNRLAREKLSLPLLEDDAFTEKEVGQRGSANLHWSLDIDMMDRLYQEYFLHEIFSGYYEYIVARMDKCRNLATIRDMLHDVKITQLQLGDTIEVVTRSFPVSTTIKMTITGKEALLKLLEEKRKTLAEIVIASRQQYLDVTTAWYARMWSGTPEIRERNGIGEHYFEGVSRLPFPIIDPLDLDHAGLPEAVKALLTANISLETCDEQGNTLVMLAARAGLPKIVDRLLHSGVNPYSINMKELSLFQQIATLYHNNIGLLKVAGEYQEKLQTQPLLPEIKYALRRANGEPKQMAITLLHIANRYLQTAIDIPGQTLEAFFLQVKHSNAIQERTWATIFQGFFDKDAVKSQRREQVKKIIRVCWQAMLLEDDRVLRDTFSDILNSAVAGPFGRRNSELLGPLREAIFKLDKGEGVVMGVAGAELFRRNSIVGALLKTIGEKDIELVTTREELVVTKTELSSTQGQLTTTQRQLAATEEELEANKVITINMSEQVIDQNSRLNKSDLLLEETKRTA